MMVGSMCGILIRCHKIILTPPSSPPFFTTPPPRTCEVRGYCCTEQITDCSGIHYGFVECRAGADHPNPKTGEAEGRFTGVKGSLHGVKRPLW